MTTRQLPREEWWKLVDTLLGASWDKLPDDAVVVVVEDCDEIVGCSALFQAWHQEGTWIAEGHRGRVSVGRHLLDVMKEAISLSGAEEVCMMATTPETEALCAKFGQSTKLQAAHYAVKVSL